MTISARRSTIILRRGSWALTMTAVLLVAPALVPIQTAQAQTFTVLHNFTGGSDGGQAGGLILDRSGILYGNAYSGGDFTNCPGGCGVVYQLKQHGSSWTLSPLYSFNGTDDGAMPNDVPTIGPDGALYGTAIGGGMNDLGTVFDLRPRPAACASVLCPWVDTIVHQFGNGDDGASPIGGVVFDAAGNLYGTTDRGGTNGNGTVWEATRSGQNWTESVIYNFGAIGSGDGVNTTGTLTIDSAGNLYGTTQSGGSGGGGTVFKLTNTGSGWTETILYNFPVNSLVDGWFLQGGVVLDSAGNIYGGTLFGGPNNGGTVYELSPSGGGYTFNVLASLGGGLEEGVYDSLTIDANGNLYGTTVRDGPGSNGFVFKLTQSNGNWTFTDLHGFIGADGGAFPVGRVAVDAQGNIFGTTTGGGTNNQGILFEITP